MGAPIRQEALEEIDRFVAESHPKYPKAVETLLNTQRPGYPVGLF